MFGLYCLAESKCKLFTKHKIALSLMLSKFQMVSSFRFLVPLILLLGIKVSGQKNMQISYTATPPQIDGLFSPDEWDALQP